MSGGAKGGEGGGVGAVGWGWMGDGEVAGEECGVRGVGVLVVGSMGCV